MENLSRWATTALLFTVLGISINVHAVPVSGQGTWETTLQGRDLDGNLATAEAYYDTVLGITWLGDASFTTTSGYDADGRMSWDNANTWAAGLDPYGSGITGWRLPETNPVNGISYNDGFSSDGLTDHGYNISAPGSAYPGSTGSEMAHLYYNTLGNFAIGLANTGPFANVQPYYGYWSATEYAANTDFAWYFFMYNGFQYFSYHKTYSLYAWAVHDGDVGASTVPIPAAAWLFGSGLLGLIGVGAKRRR